MMKKIPLDLNISTYIRLCEGFRKMGGREVDSDGDLDYFITQILLNWERWVKEKN